MSPEKRPLVRDILLQLPFMIWLVLIWMLLWHQFTPLALVTGILVAVFVTRVFRLPTVELIGRINLWYTAVFIVLFLGAVVMGAVSVAIRVFDFRRQPGAAIVEIPLRYADDIVTTHVAVTASLIPGSLVVESDRDRRILYLHVIDLRNRADVDDFRAEVLRWERRIVRAVGTPEQYRALRADEAAAAAGSSPHAERGGRR
ncbi:Na+/H+ antiporter subunit E [Microbacterium sp. YJN-G]|uniref:Na+/H+ antiporter subunit E n=1 Tax=Microbacterium sp. YJN-G TaxID=2763257 RepID=UPI0018788038|nr:Na+/H+ antiporter subunit E [Microbacterium sp. YJN-G]